jgi:hypothetical protein
LFIPDPDPDFLLIPDPGVKKAPDPRSRIPDPQHLKTQNDLSGFNYIKKFPDKLYPDQQLLGSVADLVLF